MKYALKNCRNGKEAVYKTEVDIKQDGSKLFFTFTAENCKYFCPFENYNDIHSMGDACEILIGTDPDRKTYYEIEISPKNVLMVAKMEYLGEDESGEPQLKIHFENECFVESSVTLTENGYIANVSFDTDKIKTGEGDIYFNAYRLETDGGECEKHLFALVPTMRNRFHVPRFYPFLKDYLNN